MQIHLLKVGGGFVPDGEIATEQCEKYALGELVLCNVVKPRNPLFHRKFFALLNVGFRYWEPGEISCKYGKPEKNFEQFRADTIILAGYYEVVIRLDGTTRIKPKSIKFSKMEEDDFRELYSAVINVFLKNIFNGYSEEEVVKMAEDEILRFA